MRSGLASILHHSGAQLLSLSDPQRRVSSPPAVHRTTPLDPNKWGISFVMEESSMQEKGANN
jgi:hypothetical protein